MSDANKQAGALENETRPSGDTDFGSAGAGIRLAEVVDDSVWESYKRWCPRHE